jgi:iron complex outermembrane receptor protein
MNRLNRQTGVFPCRILLPLLSLRRPFAWALGLVVLHGAATFPLVAVAAETVFRHFDIPAGPAVVTLKRFAQAVGIEIVYSAVTVADVRTAAVAGDFTPLEALERLIAQTPLQLYHDPETDAFSVMRRPDSEPLLPLPLSPPKSSSPQPMKRKSLFPAFTLWLAAAIGLSGPSAVSAADAGVTITGTVSNASTGDFLEGARIEVPALGQSTLTDNTGRYILSGLPAGMLVVSTFYTGLDPAKSTVNATAGGRVTADFNLTSGVYKLEAFKVAGQREGSAEAIMAQRNATNVKNVVAMDSFGNLPNMNASELAVLLPGVAGSLSDEGNIIGFTIRGMPPAMNTITIDGSLMGSQGGMARATRIHTITGSMFDALELTKGHTPDKEAGSLGGTINLKSRSPLSMREKRRISYNFSARVAPSGTQQIPLREQHRAHPLLNVAYQEVFGVLGGDRNLGVAVNLFYSEQAVGFFSTTRDFQNTTASPAFVWDYRTQDNYNNRKQSSVNTKFDYRLSANTKLSLNLIYNDAFERFRLGYFFRAFTGNQDTVPNATTSGIIPGYTDRITQVRPVAASTIDITSRMSNFFHRQRHVDFGAEHEFGPLQLDYNAVASIDRINGGGGDGGVLVNRVTGVGWTLDRTQSDLYPQFIQNGGPSIADPASYRPNSLNFADSTNRHEVREVRGNARYRLPTTSPLFVKTGFRYREELAADVNRDHRSIFTGINSAQLPTDSTIMTFGDRKTGLKIPAWSANAVSRDRAPIDPTLWRDDVYFSETQKFVGTREVTETVKAAYLMTQGTFGHTGFLSGVRVERTEDESSGWVRSRVPSTAAQQAADPTGSAQRDYASNRRELSGNYTKAFPSVHLTQDLTPNVKARLSWSNSFGRPPLTNLLPSETVNEIAQTLSISNPSLKPQTAESWDASLEYYFEPVGSLSAGWFHKTIRDYFVNGVLSGTVGSGADNGFNGEYSGFSILTSENLGTAIVQGWEFNYQHQFTFLPGPLKGLGISANYTLLDTHGDFGSTTTLKTGQVPGFVPRTANLILSWRYRGFGSRIVLNRTSEFLNAYTAAGSGRNQYTLERTIVNVGMAYQVNPQLSFSVDVGNVFNETQTFYRGVRDQISEVRIPGTTVTVGVSGRF